MLNLHPVPAFNDNYIWILSDDDGHCLVVDPGDATPVFDHLRETGLEPRGILVTHHHPDHVGGVSRLHEHFGMPVYGPAGETVPCITDPLEDGDAVETEAPAARFQVLHIPGHTLGHIAFFTDSGERPVLFCGDTLFAAGCGKLFEGTPEQMLASLDKLAKLPDDTLVCCGHEYTVNNLKFASTVTPDNEEVRARLLRARATRSADRPTLPATLAAERTTNPFLRADEAEVRQAVAAREPGSDRDRVATFAALRRWKDSF